MATKVTRRNFLGAAGIAAVPLLAPASPLLAQTVAPEKRSMQRSVERAVSQVKVSSLKAPWRLPVGWYRATVKRLQGMLTEKKVAGLIATSGLNQNYLAGHFLTQTERPMYLFIPAQGEPVFFHPGLDRDMVESWWVREHEWYFDFHHAGKFNQVVWEAGPTENLWEWVCRRLAKRGFDSGTLALDFEPSPSLEKKLKEFAPEVKWEDWGKELLHRRQVKTAEEIEMTQKAIDLHDAMLEFARGFILEHGTDATDYDVRTATSEFGTRLLMQAMGPELDGRPHKGVGLSLNFGCRTGPATAYPHPNQFFFKRIERGDAIQIASLIRIGGYGGEGYRACHIMPMTDAQRRMWEVHTEMTLAQQQHSRPGVECRAVASAVLQIARRAGLERFVYHRPAHGAGMEGHQAPFVSLGDATVLREGMMFSNEPGLYDPAGGYGYNHSNNVLITASGCTQMNRTPLTSEWCWLRI